MIRYLNIFLNQYLRFIEILFFAFVFCVLSFGRSFSTMHCNIFHLPFFITECLLLASIPILFFYVKAYLNLPKKFLFPLLVYFLFGLSYFFVGIMKNNFFALRDSVLCNYILFLPLTYIICLRKRRLEFLFYVVVLANIINVFLGRLYLFNLEPAHIFAVLMNNLRDFNFGLYYGITFGLLAAVAVMAGSQGVKIRERLSLVFFLACNLYMGIVIGVRSAWAGFIILFMFLSYILRKKLDKTSLCFFLLFTILFAGLYYIDTVSVSCLARFQAKPEVNRDYRRLDNVSFVDGLRKQAEVCRDYWRFDNFYWRLDIWKQAIVFGMQSPLWGKGFGVYPKYKIWGVDAPLPKTIGVDSGVIPVHNHIVSIFYKMGLFGLFLFVYINIYIFVYALKYFFKTKDYYQQAYLLGALGAFLFWHTMALFFDVIDSPPTSIFLWIIMGVMAAVVQQIKIGNLGIFESAK